MKNNEALEAEIVEENKSVILSEIKYPVSTNQIEDLLKEYAVIPNINPDDKDEIVKEQFDFVLKGHRKFVKLRGQIEKTRKALKSPSMEYGKTVDRIAKEFQSMIEDTETKLQIQRVAVEQNEARKQREAEELEEARINNIKGIINRYKALPMECIGKSSKVISEVLDLAELPTVETTEEFYDEALVIYDTSMTQIREMLTNQMMVENAQKIQAEKDEELRLAKEIEDAKLKAERDEFEKQQAEFQKKQDDFARQQREQQENIDRQNAEIEADKLQEKQRLEKIEADRLAKIEAEKAEEENRKFQEAQRVEREKQIEIDYKNRELSINETLKFMNKFNDNQLMLNEIINGQAPYLTWEM